MDVFIKKYNEYALSLASKIEDALCENMYKDYKKTKLKDRDRNDECSDSEESLNQVSSILYSNEHRKYDIFNKRKIKWFKK